MIIIHYSPHPVAPIITVPSVNQTVLLLDNATFSCTAAGIPRPDITWWTMQQLLTPSESLEIMENSF